MSRKAAAVPSKDIVVGQVYAIKVDGNLHRFFVTAVITRRERATGSPHDYTHTVEGFDHDARFEKQKLTLPLNDLLGKFEHYQELVERSEREEAEKKAKKERLEAENEAIVRGLAKVLGIELGNDRYRQPIRPCFSGQEFEINRDAMLQLVAKLGIKI